MSHDQQAQRLREIDDLLAECQRHDMTGVRVSYAQLRALRDATGELDALRKQEPEQEPVAMVVHHNPPFGAVYKVEWYTKYRDLPAGTKLYAAPVPPAAVDEVADEVVSFLSHIGFALDDREEQALLAILAATHAPVAQKVPDARLKIYEDALTKLACLGNEPLLGNSVGNKIAQDALLAAAQAQEG